MNFALNIADNVEQRVAQIQRHEDWTEVDKSTIYQEILRQIVDEDKLAWGAGDIRIGDIIFIVDSDTRVPHDCLLDAAAKFRESHRLGILQHKSGFIRIADNYFESMMIYLNEFIYAFITYTVVAGNTGPFLGYYLVSWHVSNLRHNAFICWKALQEMSRVQDGSKKWWSEAHVSEDFERSLRFQIAGWRVQFATDRDGFQEGVSLTVYDELRRWQKYGYGCVCSILTKLTIGPTFASSSEKMVGTWTLYCSFY